MNETLLKCVGCPRGDSGRGRCGTDLEDPTYSRQSLKSRESCTKESTLSKCHHRVSSVISKSLFRTSFATAKRRVELAIPWFVRAVGSGYGADLSADWVEEPGTAQQLFSAVSEHLEEQHIDRDVTVAEVSDDALGTVVEGRGHDNDLMALIERILIKFSAETLTEILGQTAVWRTAL
jgi:hypothetical protein